MVDARLAAADGFTTSSQSKVPAELDPKLTKFPSGYTACIIGASSGIGEHTAYAYATASATNVILASRDMTSLANVAKQAKQLNGSGTVEVQACDVASAVSVEKLAEFIKSKFGRLDAVVLVSGYAGPVTLRIDEGKPEWVQQAFNTNTMGTYHVAHYLMPLLLSSSNGAKTFVAIGSFAGCIRRGPIANTGYCVSKMAQIRLIEFLNEQYGSKGLLAVCMHPGAVLTPMAQGNTPEEFMPCEYMQMEWTVQRLMFI